MFWLLPLLSSGVLGVLLNASVVKKKKKSFDQVWGRRDG